ncbi:MAG: hypothetical protein GTO02_12975 [Candidatus Dadabacteria bacterium]|nr:hypothetical protein [Candidatus Dadabacteria bacterium]NIQ15263.1 hypothetical protein [Candidatus Dadabacteria bacterium]
MSKKIYIHKGRLPSFFPPLIFIFAILTLTFFIFFGAIAFLFLGALGIGFAFIKKIFGKSNKPPTINKSRADETITLNSNDYEIIDIED